MKNAGPPWLRRSDVSGNGRHAVRTLASASSTSRCGNRLIILLLLNQFGPVSLLRQLRASTNRAPAVLSQLAPERQPQRAERAMEHSGRALFLRATTKRTNTRDARAAPHEQLHNR